MSETGRLVLAVVIPGALLVGTVVHYVFLFRRIRAKRQFYTENPDQFPSRRNRILRVVPFAGILLLGGIFFVMQGRWDMVIMSGVGFACFAFLIFRIATGREELPGR